jgi:predicted DCC family thiol-disulfide oxidoreductase YuxK
LPAGVVRVALQAIFLTSSLLLLLNVNVRLFSILCGTSVLLSVLSARSTFANNLVFAAFMLILCALTRRGDEPWLVRLQVALVFFAAGLDKLLEPAWRSGNFTAAWIASGEHPLLSSLAHAVPFLPMDRILGWSTILGELSLGVLLVVPACHVLAIGGVLVFETALFADSGTTYGMFFYVMTISVLAFVRWPTAPSVVIYDGDCGICARTRAWMERIDLDSQFAWKTLESGAGEEAGVTDDMARRSLYLAEGTRVYAGFKAFRRMIYLNPAVYLLGYSLLVARGPGRLHLMTAIVALVVLSPLVNPFGEWAYRLVARNRHAVQGADTCVVGRGNDPHS